MKINTGFEFPNVLDLKDYSFSEIMRKQGKTEDNFEDERIKKLMRVQPEEYLYRFVGGSWGWMGVFHISQWNACHSGWDSVLGECRVCVIWGCWENATSVWQGCPSARWAGWVRVVLVT